MLSKYSKHSKSKPKETIAERLKLGTGNRNKK